MTAASAMGPSSHGTEKTMWSLTDNALKPSSDAALRIRDEMIEGVRMTPEVHEGKMHPELHSVPPNLTMSANARHHYRLTARRSQHKHEHRSVGSLAPRSGACGSKRGVRSMAHVVTRRAKARDASKMACTSGAPVQK